MPNAYRYEFDHEQAVSHLKQADRRLRRLMERVGPFAMEIQTARTPFESLAQSIVYQQLTGKAAATILGRVKALYGGNGFPKPQEILNTPDETLRSVGLSRAKAAAMKDLAEKTLSGVVPTMAQIRRLSNEEIIERLTLIRGIGVWTVEMMLMFRLGRPDVLPIHDYGIRKGFALTFKRKELPTPVEVAAHGERWRPYRTVASWYLWRAVDL